MPTITRARVNKTAVDRLLPDAIIRDDQLTGFGIRRQLGKPVYFLQKRVNGRVRWLTIGPHGSPWTPESARKEAHRLLGAIAGGSDPAVQRKERLENPTVAQAAKQFETEHSPKLKPATREKYAMLFRLHVVPALGTHRLLDVARPDILRLHRNLAKMPSTANYCVAMLSKFMNWAEENGYRPEQTNPCRRVKKFAETKRQRYLTLEEYARLGQVLDDLERQGAENIFVIAAIRLLLLTGARLSEILTLQWPFVDLERGFLLLPDSKTGQKQIGLSTTAIAQLRQIPKVQGNPYVIVGRFERGRLINLQKPWRRIRDLAGISDVRLHDLRHSFASVAATSGASLPMIGKLLGHTQPQTTARYSHLADDPLRQLNQRVGDAIADAMRRELS
jgi:integrase